MIQFLASLICRMFGKSCEVHRPASKALVKAMKHEVTRVEAQEVDIRKKREDIARTLGQASR